MTLYERIKSLAESDALGCAEYFLTEDWKAIQELVDAANSAICQLVEGIEFEPCGVVADRVAKQLCAILKRIKEG